MKYSGAFFVSLIAGSFVFGDDPGEQKKFPSKPCPSLCPCLAEEGKFNAFGEYLYWEVREDQMQYAVDLKGDISQDIAFFSGPQAQTVNSTVRIKEIPFKWRSGFRVGAGYELPCGTWDFQLYWTSLHEETSGSVSDPSAQIVPSEFPVTSVLGFINRGTNPVLANTAKASWHFKFDTLDLQIEKSFFPNRWVRIKPYIGVKGAWIKQRKKTDYLNMNVLTQDPTQPPTVPLNVGVEKKNNFEGVGPNFGAGANWKFATNWSLVSDLSFAMLYGRFDVKNESILQSSGFNKLFTVGVPQNRHRIRPTVKGRLGIDWDQCIKNAVILSAGIAYEVQYWWNQWQAPSSAEMSILNNSSSPEGDLMLHGLTVRAGITF